MKVIGYILGLIIAIPLAVVVAALLSATLLGGYIAIVAAALWKVALIILGVIIALKLVMKFL